MEVGKDWLEAVLKTHPLGKDVWSVCAVDREAAVGKGDNYASHLVRLNLKVQLRSGSTASRSLILKTDSGKGKHLKEWGLFAKEIKIFKEVFPLMESLLEEVRDGDEPLWCQCLETRPNDMLLLEDLKQCGYKMADKKQNLDRAHANLLLTALGKFHALSAVLKQRSMIDPDEYRETVFNTKSEMIQIFHDATFESLAEVIETTWEPEYHHYGGKLRCLMGKSLERAGALHKAVEGEFNVLNHGDCWLNNVMFKYTPGTNVPSNVRFVDFQMCSFNVPGLDLQYLIGSSVRVEVREKYLEEMLESYQRSLCSWLERLGYSDTPLPTLAHVRGWYRRMAFFGFITACMGMTFMIADPEDAPDLDLLVHEIEENKKMSVDTRLFKIPEFIKRMKSVLKHYSPQGIFSSS